MRMKYEDVLHATNKWLHFKQQTRQTDACVYSSFKSHLFSFLPVLRDVLYYDTNLSICKDWKNTKQVEWGWY